MKCTTEKPIKPGWYWVLSYDSSDWSIIRIIYDEGFGLTACDTYGGRYHLRGYTHNYKLWAGPIPEPEEE